MKIRDNYLPVSRYVSFCVSILILLLLSVSSSFAQPVNNDCNNALIIPVANSGFATGIIYSDTIDITSATMQTGETVPPPIFVAGQYQKSVWYKFTIGTHRRLQVTLEQPGISIAAGDVGFTVYKSNTCLPTTGQVSNKLTPLETFGSTYHPCVDSGQYLIQITSKANANGPIYIKLEINPVTTPYDDRTLAYSFGVMNQARKQVMYDVDCFSKESSNEICTGTLPDVNQYTKTSWHTFTTPAYFDYITFLVAAGSAPYFTNVGTQHIIGYKLYEGNAQTTPIAGLTVVDGCDTLKTNGAVPAYRTYRCGQLDPNKTYSLQLFFRSDFTSSIRVGLFREGVAEAKGPVAAVSWLQPDNQLGVLPYGTITRSDYFACNARHATNSCGNSKTPDGITREGIHYNISSYFTFTLPQASNVNITVNDPPGSTFCKKRYIRLFNGGLSNNCTTLDTNNLYRSYFHNTADTAFSCLPAGTYTIQVMGSEDRLTTITKNDVTTSAASACMYSNFGQQFNLSVKVIYILANNNYPLYQAGAYDAINNMVPLVPGTYNATLDTFGCENAVLPSTFNCAPTYKKAMYRELVLSDSLALTPINLSPQFTIPGVGLGTYMYQLFKGNANSLAVAQNVWTSPNTFTGLNPITNCGTAVVVNPVVCLVPDTYTFATYGTEYFVNKTDKPGFKISNLVTMHSSQATVGNIGSVLDSINPGNGTYSSDIDIFSCRNNAITIAGVAPCGGATKAIYREFYISQVTAINITTNNPMSIFNGRLSVVGFAGLTPFITCASSIGAAPCSPATQIFQPGWYTVVSYGSGPAFGNPSPGSNFAGGNVGLGNLIVFSVPPCPAPLYNRPYKAAINTTTNAPFLVQWNAAAAATAYPESSVVFYFPTEHWNCSVDTPFSSHPIVPCPNANRVAYFVFQLTQESYLNFTPPPGITYKLYKKDVRVDSMAFATATPLYSCSVGFSPYLEICYAQPGIYTLVAFGTGQCSSFTPGVYIDKADRSRFDHAAKAYDFGNVPADGGFYKGKVGDVNPLHPGRAASNDFFYCSTGARTTDPANSACAVIYNPLIYNVPDTNNMISMVGMTRRNLWYTFQLNKPGQVRIKVESKTPSKNFQLNFAVYKSDVDGAIPFTQVVANGLVDSTLAQGLSFTEYNGPYLTSCNGPGLISFNVPPCNFDTQRYYIVVDNRNVVGPEQMKPNHQVEVSIAVDSVAPAFTLHNYYNNAADMDTLGLGNHTGPTDYYVCATANASYPATMPACAQRTLWYKFAVDTGIVGTAKIRLRLNNSSYIYGANDFLLFRESVPGDSTATGLSQTHLASITNYRQGCVATGTYYLVLTGCNMYIDSVYPEILIEPNVGDYCNAPLVATINGAGASNATALIDCHTIGTDYGEMGATLTCPVNGVTANYKTSWFRVDVGGTDTLDLTLSLAENTDATSTQIHYRMMTGDCSAMQEQSCVPDAQTENTYQCLVPGNSYYIQVFVPKNYYNNDPAFPTMGTVTLNVSAVEHVDTCLPMNNCLVNANYIPVFDCNVNDSVHFNNFSTFGSAIDYLWDFGYNNQTSTAFSPVFLYPSLGVAVTYTVSLRAVNTNCIDTSYSVQTITIPARPVVNLGNDTSTCTAGSSIVLHATSYPGSTYLWQNASTDSLFTANLPGHHTYSVAVTFGSCTAHDSIHIYISPLVPQPFDTLLICDGQTTVTPNATRSFSGTTYLWNTNATTPTISVNTPGIYWADVSLEGCTVRDSFSVQYNLDTLSVLGEDTAICNFANGYALNATMPGATAYLWQNNSTAPIFTLTAPNTYWVRVTVNGCAYTDTIVITSLPLVESHVYDTACFGDHHILPSGDTAFVTGIYQDTLAVPNHCDSVVFTHLFVRDSIYAIAYDTICSNHFPMVWNGISVLSGGPNAAIFISQSSNGCDSTSSLNLFVHSTNNTVLNQQVCILTLPYNFLGNNISASGTYFDTLVNAHGCDSFIVLHLSVVTEFRDTLVQQVCAGGSVPFYDSVYHITGFYTHSFTSTSGCDSFKTLHLLVNPFTQPPVVNSPVVYCLGDVAQQLTATGTGLLWYSTATGGTGSTTAPTPNTTTLGQQVYYVSQTINNCESDRDSIKVMINERPVADFTVVPENIICSADSVLVTFTGYQPAGSTLMWDWSQGNAAGIDPGPYMVNWTTAGNKTIMLWVDNAGCASDTVSKSIEIKQSPEMPAIELPDYVCVYDTIAVYGVTSNNTASLNWNYNGAGITEGNSFNMSWSEAGRNYFSLSLSENGCESKLAVDSITVVDLPYAKILSDSTKICEGDVIKLNAEVVDPAATYKWSPRNYFPGEQHNAEGNEVNAKVNIAGWIYLKVTNGYSCENYDSLYVNPVHCCDLFLPNAFSPNGDGLNDIFKIQSESRQDITEFAIFNRYGQRVFISHNQDDGWDGTQNGHPSDLGTYHFYIKYICTDGEHYFRKGDVNLIR